MRTYLESIKIYSAKISVSVFWYRSSLHKILIVETLSSSYFPISLHISEFLAHSALIYYRSKAILREFLDVSTSRFLRGEPNLLGISYFKVKFKAMLITSANVNIPQKRVNTKFLLCKM